MKRDYITTFLSEIFVIATYLILFRLVAVQFGTVGFGEYALSRRTLTLLSPLAVLGLDVAVTRFVAIALGRSANPATYPVAALTVMAGSWAVLSAVLVLFREPLANLFFGSSAYTGLILPLPVLLAGGDVHMIAYAYLRGRLQVQRANVLMVVNQGTIPLVAVATSGHSVVRILCVMGVGWLVAGLLALALAHISARGSLTARMRELTQFGLQRVPGDIFQFALFAAPAALVAHRADIRLAGLTAFGIAALGMIGSALSPISFILLPVASRSFASGSVEGLRHHVLTVARLTLVVLLLGVGVGELVADRVIAVYLGPAFVPGVSVLRVLMAGAVPWGVYLTLKSLVDARHQRAVNARNMAAASLFFFAVSAGLLLAQAPELSFIIGFVISLYLLAALTLVEVRRVLRDTLGLDSEVLEQDSASAGALGGLG